MTMPTKSQTIATDEIADLQRRIVLAARERSAFLGLGSEDTAAEVKAAQKVAKALGEQLRAEHATRTGQR